MLTRIFELVSFLPSASFFFILFYAEYTNSWSLWMLTLLVMIPVGLGILLTTLGVFLLLYQNRKHKPLRNIIIALLFSSLPVLWFITQLFF